MEKNEYLEIGDLEVLTVQEYKEYLEEENIFYIDSHGALISTGKDRPMVATKKQMQILIEHLQNTINQIG